FINADMRITKIQDLQNQVDTLKQNAENNKKRNEMIENYETSIDKLKKTKNEKDNGNTEAM
ncbi:MAG: hypothetical protein E7I99_10315, partial [Streptococcus mitis]|nr:hypothetical protein [Streptococcus mitis]